MLVSQGWQVRQRLWVLQRTKTGDFTLRGLVAELAERGLKVDYRSVWDFVHAEKLSFAARYLPALDVTPKKEPDPLRRAHHEKFDQEVGL